MIWNHIKTCVIIPDVHIPWHDRRAVDIAFTIIKNIIDETSITQIIILGDFLDFYWVTMWDKLELNIKNTFQDELYSGNKHLELLRKICPDAQIDYVEGNHEDRYLRYVTKKCPELYGVIPTIEELLLLEERNINFHKYGKFQLVRCLDTNYFLRHSPYSYGVNFCSSSLNKGHISLGFGCTHRRQSFIVKDAAGIQIEAHGLGWLGDASQPVFNYNRSIDLSTQSIQVVTSINGTAHIQNIPIIDGVARYNNSIFIGSGDEIC